MPKPRVIYEAKPGSPIAVDRAVYDRLARETHSRTLVEQFVVPMRAGRAWPVRAGRLFRMIAMEGQQVADFNAWSLGNPRERFWASRTKQLHRAHVSTYDRLWSCLPYLRPMLTITNDNRLRARRGRGGLPRSPRDPDDRYFVKASPAKRGDFIELLAEIDVLCAISTCPHGDLSVQMWGVDAGDPLATCRPLGVEIWQPDPALLGGWRPPAAADYRGDHGLGRG